MEKLISLGISASVFTLVLCLGLETRLSASRYLLRRPGLAARSLLSMNVIMPLVAAVLAVGFHLHPAIKIALVALAVSPVPPMLPKKVVSSGGKAEYALGLLVGEALLSIVLVPVSVALIAKAVGLTVLIPAAPIAKTVFSMVLIPLAIGVAIGYAAPASAKRWASSLSKIAMLLLVVSLLPILFIAWPTIRLLIGNGTLLAIVLFSIVGFTTGHLLGGPEDRHRTVLAFFTPSRHPGIAISIANIGFPQEKAAIAAILLVLIVNAVVSKLYLSRRNRSSEAGRIAA